MKPIKKTRLFGSVKISVFCLLFLLGLAFALSSCNSDGAITIGPFGDYSDLVEAVSSVAPGSTIRLGTDTFVLTETLEIDKPITIVGDGKDKTVVISEAPGMSIHYTGQGIFTLKDITIKHQGQQAANVIVVDGGEIGFSECRVSGGVKLEEGGIFGDGLRILNNATGTVSNCELIENAGGGVGVGGNAQIDLEGNTCSLNLAGIVFTDFASGTATNNRCEENTGFGIAVLHKAKPILISNEIHNNTGAGIYYALDEDGGETRLNKLSGNSNLGTDIFISGSFAPIKISDNECSRELSFGWDLSGILFEAIGGIELPENVNLLGNACAVAECSGPSLFSMSCK
jgi:parallel beta-helix repeat protein